MRQEIKEWFIIIPDTYDGDGRVERYTGTLDEVTKEAVEVASQSELEIGQSVFLVEADATTEFELERTLKQVSEVSLIPR